jgi:excisionase family DNA binding protein
VTEYWVSAVVVAEHLGVTEDSVDAWAAKENMPSRRVGSQWKFKVNEVDEWVRREDADDTAKLSRKEGR